MKKIKANKLEKKIKEAGVFKKVLGAGQQVLVTETRPSVVSR